jgi:response regulator RpfG family c-di-GMP phosphodiesterase
MSTSPNNNESRLTNVERAVKELEDALVVMAHLEKRQSNLIREQAEYLAEHERRLRETEQRNRETDERIEKLVSAIGELIRRDLPSSERHGSL